MTVISCRRQAPWSTLFSSNRSIPTVDQSHHFDVAIPNRIYDLETIRLAGSLEEVMEEVFHLVARAGPARTGSKLPLGLLTTIRGGRLGWGRESSQSENSKGHADVRGYIKFS